MLLPGLLLASCLVSYDHLCMDRTPPLPFMRSTYSLKDLFVYLTHKYSPQILFRRFVIDDFN